MASIDWNDPAFAEISKSGEMQGLLGQHAARLAAQANAAAKGHAAELYKKRFETDPYDHTSKVLSNSAIGVAYAKTKVGVYMEAKHKCLGCQNH